MEEGERRKEEEEKEVKRIGDGGRRRGGRRRRGVGPTPAQYLAITARYMKNKYKLVTIFKK
jgi:hypothetical protein